MREEVIVHVKEEIHSEDEEEIDPSTIPQSSTGITAEVSSHTAELNLENSSLDSHGHDWPCAVCGRLFTQREEVLEHTKSEHAEQMFQEMLLDEGLRAKLAAFQQQQRLIALLQSGGPAAMNMLQQPAAAAVMLQLLQGISAPVVKNEVALMPSFPVPSRKVNRMEKDGSPYESRRGSFPGRPRHPVWSLFVRIDKFDAECTLCKSRVRSACPTNLCRHLNNNHCELASQLFVKWKKQKEDLGGSFPPLEPRANRHKSSSTSSTSSSISCSSLPAAPVPTMAPIIAPSLPGFPHLNLVLQQQQLLLKQREEGSSLSPEVLKAIDAQLLVNSKIIAQAQKALESHNLSAAAAAATAADPQPECAAGTSRAGVIQFGGSERQSEEEPMENGEAIDILSISPDLDAIIDSSTAAAAASKRRSSSAPPPFCCSCGPSRRPSSVPPMIALMDGNNAFEMYGYQDMQQSQQQLQQLQQRQGAAAAALRQPSQQTLENWFTTAYAQPVQLEANAVMNAGAYGTMAPQTDAAGLAAAVAESASFPADIKNLPLFSEEHQQLFAASSSSSIDTQQQLQLFQAVKQELQLDEMEDSSHRPSVFQTAPPSSSLMSQLLPGQPPAKRGRPTENPCWEHFDRLDDTLVKCRTSDKVVKSACATNMTKHLERHHPEEYQVLLQKIRYSRQFKPNTTPATSSSPATSSTQQFPSSTMALNHLTHQPQHHLLQPMASDLGQQLTHHLPLSPDPSPAAPHCFLSTQHHLLKDPSSLRPEMLLIPTSDGLIPNVDPNSYHIPSDFYQTMQFDNSLFDNASQWQQRHFAPTSGYEQWMGADQSGSAMLMPDEWSQSAAAAAAVVQHQQQQQQQAQQQLNDIHLQSNTVIQSAV
ncbi:dpy-20, partial [Pristionchus pacificus]